MNQIFTPGLPRTVRTLVATILLAAFFFQNGNLAVAQAATPAWWVGRGALTAGSTAEDYAAINQGQIKNLARAARDEMNANLSGGAGAAINALVNAWTASPSLSDDYAVVTTGQLKALAAPFYDRLLAAGLASGYPWDQVGATADDYAVANIGQAKNLFCFSIPVLSDDSDGDGLPDWWEIANYGGLQYGADDMPDGDGIKLSDKYAAVKDTDNDGSRDVDEAALGTNPLWKDHPAVNLMVQGYVFP